MNVKAMPVAVRDPWSFEALAQIARSARHRRGDGLAPERSVMPPEQIGSSVARKPDHRLAMLAVASVLCRHFEGNALRTAGAVGLVVQALQI
jgi:hypothetical protein